MSRYVIVGGPGSPKDAVADRLAAAHGLPIRKTDSLRQAGAEWSDQSEAIAAWLAEPGADVIVGSRAVHGIRKWLRAHPGAPAATIVFVESDPAAELSPGQRSLASGIRKVWTEIAPELTARGAAIVTEGA